MCTKFEKGVLFNFLLDWYSFPFTIIWLMLMGWLRG